MDEQESWLSWAREMAMSSSPFEIGYPQTSIDGAFANAHSSTGNLAPWFVGVKLHDNDLFADQSAWTYVYQPLGRPRPWDPTAKPALLSETERTLRRNYYLNLVSEAASRSDDGCCRPYARRKTV